jgi:LCP family protein required for cell wall assembly
MKKDYTEDKQKSKERKKLITEIVIFAVLLTIIAVSTILTLLSDIGKALSYQKPIYGLIIGCDETSSVKHSDTIILVGYFTKSKLLRMLSIPRDTYILSPESKTHRINEIFATIYAKTKDVKNAAETLKIFVENIVFKGKRKISFWIVFDYSSFQKFINVLGNVKIDIHEPMSYDDNYGHLHIHFSTGIHYLDGKKALEFVRYRSMPHGDIDRITNQQYFIRQLLYQKILTPKFILKMPLLLNVITEISTNLSVFDFILLSQEIKNFNPSRTHLLLLPGKFEYTYWKPNLEALNIISTLFTEEGNENVATNASLAKYKDVVKSKDEKVYVEVWNATRKQKLALWVRNFLIKDNIDVLRWGNYGGYRQTTTIIDKTGNIHKVNKILKYFPNAKLITNIEKEPEEEIEIILGEDFDPQKLLNFSQSGALAQ